MLGSPVSERAPLSARFHPGRHTAPSSPLAGRQLKHPMAMEAAKAFADIGKEKDNGTRSNPRRLGFGTNVEPLSDAEQLERLRNARRRGLGTVSNRARDPGNA